MGYEKTFWVNEYIYFLDSIQSMEQFVKNGHVNNIASNQ
jgi:hypothetical protein